MTMNSTRRKPRKLLRTAFTIFTLLLIAGYVASGWCYVEFAGRFRLDIGGGHIQYFDGYRCGTEGEPPPLSFQFQSVPRFGARFNYLPLLSGHYFEAPLWPIAAASLFLTALWRWRDWRRQHRPNHCPNCNYDLRATPNRCPECGHTAETTRS